MLRDMLNLTTVQVSRETVTPDGMGGSSTSTSLTTLSYSAIWQSGSANRWMSDRVMRESTHILACEPSAYSWTQDDRQVINGSETYKIIGRPDDIMNNGEIVQIPLERQT